MTSKRQITRDILDIVKAIDLSPTKENLSPLQLETLFFIKRKGCVKATEIAKGFNVTPATITIQIDRLEKNGWVERCFDTKDKRATNITCSQKCEKELDKVIEGVLDRYNWVFDTLTKEEIKSAQNILRKVKGNIPSKKN